MDSKQNFSKTRWRRSLMLICAYLVDCVFEKLRFRCPHVAMKAIQKCCVWTKDGFESEENSCVFKRKWIRLDRARVQLEVWCCRTPFSRQNVRPPRMLKNRCGLCTIKARKSNKQNAGVTKTFSCLHNPCLFVSLPSRRLSIKEPTLLVNARGARSSREEERDKAFCVTNTARPVLLELLLHRVPF